MRVKLLRDAAGATVRLVYPSTLHEYGEAFEALGALAAPAGDDGPNADGGVAVAIRGSYVVTTEWQRAGWQLPDLCSGGGARVVDESEAFGLLRTPAAAPPPRWDSGSDGSVSEALRALGEPDTRLEQVFEALGRVDLPGGVCETLRRELRRALLRRGRSGRWWTGRSACCACRGVGGHLRVGTRRGCRWRWSARTAVTVGPGRGWSRRWGPVRRAAAC